MKIIQGPGKNISRTHEGNVEEKLHVQDLEINSTFAQLVLMLREVGCSKKKEALNVILQI
jgi:hypothetical protein